jgi:hypothetical protein
MRIFWSQNSMYALFRKYERLAIGLRRWLLFLVLTLYGWIFLKCSWLLTAKLYRWANTQYISAFVTEFITILTWKIIYFSSVSLSFFDTLPWSNFLTFSQTFAGELMKSQVHDHVHCSWVYSVCSPLVFTNKLENNVFLLLTDNFLALYLQTLAEIKMHT